MPIHHEHRGADVRGVLDEFEGWLLRERSVQERTAGAYTTRVAGFVAWLRTPTEESLRCLSAATVLEWVNLEAAQGLKSSTLRPGPCAAPAAARAAPRAGETVGHVDRDPLLVLGAQAIGEQREVGVVVALVHRGALDRLQLVLKDRLGVQQQPPDRVDLPSSTEPAVAKRSRSIAIRNSLPSCGPPWRPQRTGHRLGWRRAR